MSDLGYLGDMAKKYDGDFLTALHSKAINVIRTCEVIGDTDIFNIVDRVMASVADIIPEDVDIEKYAFAIVRTHSMASKTRDIYREIASKKHNTLFPTAEQIEEVKNIPGKYCVENANSNSWDDYYYNVTKQVARNSKCLSRKIGALLVKDKTIVSTGYNGPPRGVPHCGIRHKIDPQLLSKYKSIDKYFDPDVEVTKCPRQILGYNSGEGLDLCVAGHAEENTILSCAREGISTKGSTMYMTCSIPCFRCMIKIINAGISELVVTGTKFYDDNTMFLLSNSDVEVRLYDFC